MVLLLVAVAVASMWPGLDASSRRQVTYGFSGLALAYVAWERWRYTEALDELARRLYLEAFAITYLVGLALFSVLGMVHELSGWTISPLTFVLLEPVRAAVLTWRARRMG